MLRRSIAALLLAGVLAACSSGSDGADTEIRQAGQAGSGGTVVADTTESESETDAIDGSVDDAEPTSTAAPSSSTSVAQPSTSIAPPSTTVAPSTTPPVTVPAFAPCVSGEINLFTTGRRGEIALYQQTLADRGYDPGGIDGFFGPNTYAAASQEIFDNGNIDGPNGIFEELFIDDGAVLPGAFERLGIACVDGLAADL